MTDLPHAPSQSEAENRLYADRVKVYPRKVKGTFRRIKWIMLGLVLTLYYGLPFIRFDRGAGLPDQAILIDMEARRAYFFWIEIWPQEVYILTGVLIFAAVALFFVTSIAGRLWCAYACPQTVWTDLFMLVERWIEGDRNARLRLHRQKKMDFRKFRLNMTKWIVWLLIAVATGGAWVFYFADAPTLFVDLFTLNAHPIAYTTVAFLTATTFFFGGFAREQICIYACPWPRIQAAMMDEDTLVVGYRPWRGEPRKHSEEVKAGEPQGDCIDCMACVNVCPVGIDIRDGQQLECITCALCIDACDEIMEKTGKPRGLIDYMALSDEPREREGQPPKNVWKHILRPRTIMYTSLWSIVGFALVFALFIRQDIEMTVAPVRNPTFVTLSDGSIRNTYDVRILNKSGTDSQYSIFVKGDPTLRVQLEGTPYGSVQVAADTQKLQRVYVISPAGSAPTNSDRTEFRFWVEDLGNGDRAYSDSVFNGQARN